jgi:ankyrin repeat protein
MSRTKKGLSALVVMLAVVGIAWVLVFKKDSDLLNACERCDAAEVERLLESGANPNAHRLWIPSASALMLGVSCDKWGSGMIGNPQVVKLLIEKGADVKKRYRRNHTALHRAVGNVSDHDEEGRRTGPRGAPGNGDVVKLLLAAGADVNAGRNPGPNTPLDYAVWCNGICNNREVIHALIQHGAISGNAEKCGFMSVARECSWNDIVELYKQRGCDPCMRYDDRWNWPQDRRFDSECPGNPEDIRSKKPR